MPNLVGREPNQVPTNGMLGTAAFVNKEELPVSTAQQTALDAKVGTTGPQAIAANSASAALTVTQTGAGNAFVVEDSASTDSTPFVIDGTGRAVIGFTSGVADSSGATRNLQVLGTSGTAAAQLISRFSADVNPPTSVFAKSRGATISAHATVQSSDELGRISFDGSDGTGFINAALIQVLVDGTPGTNDMPGRLVFSTTADGASSPTERMRIDSAGGISFNKTVTAAATTGAQTINTPTGTVNFAAAAASLVVTNSLVTANSIIVCTVGTVDATMKSVVAVAGTGAFTLTANAAATAETRVNFLVLR